MLPADPPFAPLPAPGPHPAPAELRAYAAGTLAPAAEHRIEAHALDCERCADVLAGLAMSDPATTDQAVAELRVRLQARVGPADSVLMPASGGWAWPRLAAAAALLSAVAGGIWGWQRYEPVPATARLETVAAPAPSAASSGAPALVPAAPAAPEVATADARADARAKAMAEVATTAALATPEAADSPRPADYAAGAAAPRPPSGAFGRLARPTAQAAVESAELSEIPNQESKMEAAGSADMALASQAPPAARKMAPSAAASSAAAPSAVASDAPAADTLAHTSPNEPDRQYAKAKANISAMAAGNAARVASTPMPMAPAIGPAPVGGTVALREYLRREAAAFEPEAGASRLSGLVRLKFTVGADGKVSNLHVVRGLRPDYDAEALRLLCEGPTWQPGVAGGRRAALPVETTVAF